MVGGEASEMSEKGIVLSGFIELSMSKRRVDGESLKSVGN